MVHDAIDVEKRHSHFVVNMTSEQKQLQGEVALLENSLRKIKAYSDKEKKLIEKQVEEFKQQYAQSSTSSDIDKLLLDSSEVIMDEVLGKVREKGRSSKRPPSPPPLRSHTLRELSAKCTRRRTEAK